MGFAPAYFERYPVLDNFIVRLYKLYIYSISYLESYMIEGDKHSVSGQEKNQLASLATGSVETREVLDSRARTLEAALGTATFAEGTWEEGSVEISRMDQRNAKNGEAFFVRIGQVHKHSDDLETRKVASFLITSDGRISVASGTKSQVSTDPGANVFRGVPFDPEPGLLDQALKSLKPG